MLLQGFTQISLNMFIKILRERESNPYLQVMSLICYRYTISRLKLAHQAGLEPALIRYGTTH